jgi:hypothetical protein
MHAPGPSCLAFVVDIGLNVNSGKDRFDGGYQVNSGINFPTPAGAKMVHAISLRRRMRNPMWQS